MRTVLIAATAIVLGAAPVLAQTPSTPMNSMPHSTAPASGGSGSATGSSNPAVNTGGNASSSVNASGKAQFVSATALEKGSNSFTEGQAKTRLEGAGLQNVSELKKDDQGIWRGRASRNGKSVAIGFDYKGNIAAE